MPFESSLRKNCQFQLTKQQNESVRSCSSALQPTTCTHMLTQHTHMLAHVKRGTGVLYVRRARLKAGRRPLSFISVCLGYSVLMSVRE